MTCLLYCDHFILLFFVYDFPQSLVLVLFYFIFAFCVLTPWTYRYTDTLKDIDMDQVGPI